MDEPDSGSRAGHRRPLGLCVTGLTGAARPLATAPFALYGHWVPNSLPQSLFHVGGDIANVDARLPVSSISRPEAVRGADCA